MGSGRTVTVVQCHPNANILAIGDNTGRIVLYHDVLHKNTRSQTVYHWHTLPVNDVIFTSSGELFINHVCTFIKNIMYNIGFIDFRE